MINFTDEFQERLDQSKNILLVGASGGFDVLSCLPLYYKLKSEEKEITMVNFTRVNVSELNEATEPQVLLKDRLFMVGSNIKAGLQHYPAGMTSLWFEQTYDEQVPFYLIAKQSIPQMTECYHKIIEKTKADTIIFCGFGMRSIMIGDEQGCGDMLFSTMNMSAIKNIENVQKLLMTIGLETTVRHKVSYNSVLDNIALHTQWGSYLGLSCLRANDTSFQYMKHCYDFIASKEYHERDVLAELILLGITGRVGQLDSGDKVTPLMTHVHCFDLQSVANANKISILIDQYETFDDVVQHGMGMILNNNKVRKFTFPEI